MMYAITHLALQQYWWMIVCLLAGLLVFLMFVQGGQTLIYSIGKTEIERTMIINTFGRKWEFTFTTLVTFGGAFFASFPLFYATSFGGAYWVWTLILFSFVIQAVSYEYRTKPENFLGKKTYEGFLIANGVLGTVLIGTAVGTMMNGAQFSLDIMNNVDWQTPWRGLEAVLNLHNVLLGITIFFLARVLGAQYILNSIEHETIETRTVKILKTNAGIFVVLFLTFVITLLFKSGFSYNPETMLVEQTPYKFFQNFINNPHLLLMFLVGVIGVLYGIGNDIFLSKRGKGIWYSGAGTILTIWSLLMSIGFNNSCYYPSNFDIQSSLNIVNSSSSFYTLKVMSFVSILIPFVIAYIWYAWKSINNKKITQEEIEKGDHIY